MALTIENLNIQSIQESLVKAEIDPGREDKKAINAMVNEYNVRPAL